MKIVPETKVNSLKTLQHMWAFEMVNILQV